MHSSQFVEIGYSNLDNFHFETAYWVILMKSQRGSKALGKKCLTEIQAVKKGGKPFVLVQLWGRGVATIGFIGIKIARSAVNKEREANLKRNRLGLSFVAILQARSVD